MTERDEPEGAGAKAPAQRTVSGPAAVLIVLGAMVVFLVLFSRPHLAPEGRPILQPPPIPEIPDEQLTGMRQGLMPLGIGAVMPPLPQDRMKGVRVAWVVPGSPAHRAGIRVGDFITSFGDRTVTHPGSIVAVVSSAEAGAEYRVALVRSGEELEVVVSGLPAVSPEERPARMR